MGKQFLKDLPIYLNGIAVGMLLWDIPKISVLNISMYVLAMVTFFWYGKNKQSGGGMVDAGSVEQKNSTLVEAISL